MKDIILRLAFFAAGIIIGHNHQWYKRVSTTAGPPPIVWYNLDSVKIPEGYIYDSINFVYRKKTLLDTLHFWGDKVKNLKWDTVSVHGTPKQKHKKRRLNMPGIPQPLLDSIIFDEGPIFHYTKPVWLNIDSLRHAIDSIRIKKQHDRDSIDLIRHT